MVEMFDGGVGQGFGVSGFGYVVLYGDGFVVGFGNVCYYGVGVGVVGSVVYDDGCVFGGQGVGDVGVDVFGGFSDQGDFFGEFVYDDVFCVCWEGMNGFLNVVVCNL